jgi:general secretion pathway protein K
MRQQRGSVILVVLWTSIVLTVLVTVMAARVQLSARTALHNQQAVYDAAAVAEAMHFAEMELMLEQMRPPLDEVPPTDDLGNVRLPAYRFNGQPLTLHYPAGQDIVVRIFDHAGKINLNRLEDRSMLLLLQHWLGPDADPRQADELLAAWRDWRDLDAFTSPNGAEADYYEALDVPYIPRNFPELETVEDLRLIRGFDELFKDVNLDAAFTVYGSTETVNLNLATREAMRLLPGLNEALIDEILTYRETRDFNNRNDVGAIVPLENFVELSSWIGNFTSSYFSVYAYPRAPTALLHESAASEARIAALQPPADSVQEAYMEILQIRNLGYRPTVHQVNPHALLPDTSAPSSLRE